MIIAPIESNLLASGTFSDAAAKYELGAGTSTLVDADPMLRCRPRGTWIVESAVYDRIDGNDGAGFVATVTPGTYNSPAEFAQAVVKALNTASTNWYAYQIQAATNRYQWVVGRTSGSASLQISSGANTARNILRYLMGFRNEDRSSAASHTGDFVAGHGTRQDIATCDLASALPATCSFVAGLDISEGAAVSVGLGSTSAATDATWIAGDATSDTLYLPYTTPAAYRYVRLAVSDRHRDDRARIGVGYWWHGVAFDTDAATRHDPLNWEFGTFSRSGTVRYAGHRMQDGSMAIGEVRPGERFAVAFSGQPGLSPSQAAEFRRLALALGRSGKCFVCLDTTEPARTSRLCRVDPLQFEHIAKHSQLGRWGTSIAFEVVQ